MGITEIPAVKTCTSLPQMWHQPRGGRIVTELGQERNCQLHVNFKKQDPKF